MGAVRVAVVGVGHFGRLHAATYKRVPGAELAAVVDSDPERAAAAAREFDCEPLTDHRALADKVDAASVAVPTEHHLAVGRDLLRAGLGVLVEKPIARTVEEGRALMQEAEAAGKTLQVGHLERFNPAVAAIEPFIESPRFIECHRISPFKARAVDVGVVLDVMIHDLDIVLHIAGSPVRSVEAMGLCVLSEKEDLVNARVVFENGCVANLTASRISVTTMRKVRVFQKNSYMSLDCLKKEAVVYRKSPRFKDLPSLLAKAAEHGGSPEAFLFRELLDMDRPPVSDLPPLDAELASFVKSVADGTRPAVSGDEGLRAVAAAQMIMDEMRLHTQ